MDLDFLPNIVNSIAYFPKYIICHIAGVVYIAWDWLAFQRQFDELPFRVWFEIISIMLEHTSTIL